MEVAPRSIASSVLFSVLLSELFEPICYLTMTTIMLLLVFLLSTLPGLFCATDLNLRKSSVSLMAYITSGVLWHISDDNAETLLFTCSVAGIIKVYIANSKCLIFIIQMSLETSKMFYNLKIIFVKSKNYLTDLKLYLWFQHICFNVIQFTTTLFNRKENIYIKCILK